MYISEGIWYDKDANSCCKKQNIKTLPGMAPALPHRRLRGDEPGYVAGSRNKMKKF